MTNFFHCALIHETYIPFPFCVITIYSDSAMPYNDTIKWEATHVANIGLFATERQFAGLYDAILHTSFPASKGYFTDYQRIRGAGEPDRLIPVIRRGGGNRNLLLVLHIMPPVKWNSAGKQEALEDLTKYIQGWFDETEYDTIYGLGGIGLHWMVCKLEKGGSPVATTVLDWHDNISSDLSYDAFKTVADLLDNLH
jgi:hypothetical protein